MRSLILILAFAAFAHGAEPLKALPAPDAPIVIRMPTDAVGPPSPATPARLTNTLQYIFDATGEVFPQCSPDGLVTITKETGPIKVKGFWADKPNDLKATSRTFAGPFVYQLEPVVGAVGRVELFVVPKGVTDPKKILRRLIDVDGGQAPQPPPVPVPPVPPQPQPPPVPPGPAPTPVPVQAGVWAIVIANEAAPTAAQGRIIDGPSLRSLKAAGKCRVYGSATEADKIAKKGYDRLMSDAKLIGDALLILDATGHKVFAGVLPMDEAVLAATLKENMKP